MPTDSGPPPWHLRLGTRLALWCGLVLFLGLALAMLAFYASMLEAMRRHADERILGHAAEVRELLREGGPPAAAAGMARRARLIGVHNVFFVLRDGDGATVASSDLSEWARFPTQWPASAGDGSAFDYRSGPDGHDRVRVARIPLGGGFVLEEGLSTPADHHVIGNIRVVFAVILAGAAGLVAVAGLLMARYAVAGMTRVTEAAAGIARSAELHRRVPVPARRDEVGWQARTFNTMIERIERIVGDMRETHDDIAHELRSPVACIRGAAEAALMAPHSAEEYRAALAGTVEECDRLLEILNTMLDIADANAGVGLGRVEEIDLAELARWGCDLFAPVAEEKRVTILREGIPPLLVLGDAGRLRRCLANLLDNAIKYSPEGGQVGVACARRGDGTVEVAVSNACRHPLGKEDWPKLFDRFYRSPEARSVPGTGLGLSLARSIARAHGGDILAGAGGGGGRAAFTLVLPEHSARVQ